MKLTKWFPFKFKRDKKKPQADKTSDLSAVTRPDSPAPMIGHLFDDPFFRRPLFSDPFRSLSLFSDGPGWFGDFSLPVFQPRIDVSDDEQHLKISAELPGLDKEDIQLSLTEDLLTLSGEKKLEKTDKGDDYYRCERSYGSFERRIPLPSYVDRDAVEAHFDKGILTIRFPKTESEKSESGVSIQIN